VGPVAGLDGCGKSRPHRDFFVFSCTLYFIRTWFFVLIVLFAFCLYLQHKHPSSRRDSNPQPQQAIGRRPSSLGRSVIGIARIRTANRPADSESLCQLSYCGPVSYQQGLRCFISPQRVRYLSNPRSWWVQRVFSSGVKPARY
jgi:hypothetical protein